MKKRLFSLVLALILSAGTAAAVSAAEAETFKQYSIVELVKPQYENVGVMVDGYANVKVNGKWGVIDETGKFVIEAKYDYLGVVENGVALAGIALPDTFTTIDQNTGEEVVIYSYNMYVVNVDGSEKQLVFDPATDTMGDYYAETRGTDANGMVYVQCMSDNIDNVDIYNDGDLIYVDNKFFKSNGTQIVVNDPDKLLSYTTESGNVFEYNTFLMVQGSAYEDGVIAAYSYCRPLNCPIIAFYMDIDGNVIKTFDTYEPNDYDFETGKTIWNLKKGIYYAYQPEDGYSAVYCTNDRGLTNSRETDDWGWGVVNADGEFVIEPVYTAVNYTYGNPIVDGNISLKNREGKWGVMNVMGEIVIPFVYDSAPLLRNGFAEAWVGDDVSIIDAESNVYNVVDENGNVLDIDNVYMMLENGICRVRSTDGKIYLIDNIPENGALQVIGSSEYYIAGGDGTYWTTYAEGVGYGFIKVVEEVAAEAEEECNYPVTWSPLWRSVTGGSLIG